jgi:hypothetical protein
MTAFPFAFVIHALIEPVSSSVKMLQLTGSISA